jgi:8-oxo-dGTP pyrophosphatase MutT (NUDIX family)
MEIERPKSNQPIPNNAKRVFRGVLFDVYQWEQEMFDGTRAIFEKIKRPDTVNILSILPDGKILLTEQEQPGTNHFIGLIGGRVDEKENILVAAKRELLEESGYEAEEFILWHAEQPINKIDWAIYTFIAKGLKKVSEMNLDAGEKIKLNPVTFDELIEIATSKSFYERDIAVRFFEAKLDPKKYKELKELFKPLKK